MNTYVTVRWNRNHKLLVVLLIFSFVLVFSSLPAQAKGRSDGGVAADEVDRIKDQVLNRKTQLKLLRSILKEEEIETSYPSMDIKFTNEMSDRYRLHSLIYYIDGVRTYSFLAEEGSEGRKEASKNAGKYSTTVAPGRHSVRIVAFYLGQDSGVFSYLSDYKVRTEALGDFQVNKGSDQKIEIVAFEKGGVLTDFKERPGLKIKVGGRVVSN